MPISTWDGDLRDDNEGPHCRNCHIGAAECFTCHTNDDRFDQYVTWANKRDVSSAYTSTVGQVANMNNYAPQASLRQSAVVGGTACLSGGFSFPHRTLGANMLKDELFGIDFNGVKIAAGATRAGNASLAADAGLTAQVGDAAQVRATSEWYYFATETRNAGSLSAAVRNDASPANLAGAAAENLDSVCIDCHGDSTYWNGNNTALLKTEGTSTGALGIYNSGEYGGWELLLKGLP
jgi:hypothetical protein